MSPRTFIVLVGALCAVIGFVGLVVTVEATTSGTNTVPCGNGFALDTKQASYEGFGDELGDAFQGVPASRIDDYSGTYVQRCRDAVRDRRAWAWPLFIGGLAVVAGGLVVQARKRDEATQQQASSAGDSA